MCSFGAGLVESIPFQKMFSSKQKKLRAAAIFIVLASMLVLLLPQGAYAAEDDAAFSWLDCLTSRAACGVYYTTYLINLVVGLLINLASFFIGVGLIINSSIVASPTVQ